MKFKPKIETELRLSKSMNIK